MGSSEDFTSDFELTKEELEEKFLAAHWKEYAEDGDLDPGGMAEGGRPGKGLNYLMGM